MLRNYSKSNWWALLVLPLWVLVSFYAAKIMLNVIIWALDSMKIPIELINQTVLSTLISALIYFLTLVFVLGLPWLIKRHSTSRIDIGLTRLPSWTDILLTPAGLVVYFILSALLLLLITRLIPWIDVDQVQEVGFRQINKSYEYILAFTSLVIIAPIAEEILFRGYLYGKLKKFVPIWIAIIVTSLLFGLIHGAWNLAIDTFALSIVLCLLRESTGNIWASILLHMTKNGIAFYILFINPTLLATLGG